MHSRQAETVPPGWRGCKTAQAAPPSAVAMDALVFVLSLSNNKHPREISLPGAAAAACYLQRDVAGVDARDLDVGTHQAGGCQLELDAVQGGQTVRERDGQVS